MAEDNDAPAAAERRRRGIATYRDVMKSDPPARSSPFTEIGMLDFVFAEVWARPGLSRRDRRFVSLACVAAADAAAPIEEHVYAALASGDITFEEMQEVVLHFAVYCGWPKGSFFEQVTWSEWARLHAERGETMPPPQPLPYPPTPGDPELRLQGGEQEFRDVNHVPAPPRTSPYTQAGILNFVFGEMWQRPNLGRRERRLVTVACVALDDTPVPIRSHVYSAMKSGDLTLDEMQEVVLHFAAYYGWPKASFLNQVVAEEWERIQRG